MNKFTVNYSSSPPLTPQGADGRLRSHPLFTRDMNHPSTTPAGPPPSSAASFTPAGPPPSSAFGSSRLGSAMSKLQFNQGKGETSGKRSPPPRDPFLPRRGKDDTPARPKAAPFWPANPQAMSTRQAEDEDPSMLSPVEGDDPSVIEGDLGGVSNKTMAPDGDSMAKSSPRFRSSRAGTARPRISKQPPANPQRLSQLRRRGDDGVVPALARDLAARSEAAPLTETNRVIMQTEEIMMRLHGAVQNSANDRQLQDAVSAHAHELIQTWKGNTTTEDSETSRSGIGPPASAPPFDRANHVASLLLALYEPPLLESETSWLGARQSAAASPRTPTAMILLDWLDNYHVSYDAFYEMVRSATPNCTAHDLFWDAVQSLVLRGKLEEVIQLLDEADFRYAATGYDDSRKQKGYQGAQLQTVQAAVYRASQILESCPGASSRNWNVDGPEWDLFRKTVFLELDHLNRLADARDPHDDDGEDSFQAENFGIRKGGRPMLSKSKQSASNLPWPVFQSLKIMYSILLGSADEIISQSQDWLEAAASLTVWWDATEEDSIQAWNLSVSRARRQEPRSPGHGPYLVRLRDSFLSVTDPDDQNSFQINTLSPVELGLAAVLQGDIQGALAVLRTLSLCVTSATAEIGSYAGWLVESTRGNQPGLDEEDLMVLSYGVRDTEFEKDGILSAYADALFHDPRLAQENGSVEGWEFALSVTSRLSDEDTMRSETSKFIADIPLDNRERANKLATLCSELGLGEDARKVSERYADYLVETEASYGAALLWYARGCSRPKIRQLFDLLISFCLVQSTPYPAVDDIDDQLRQLVESPRAILSGIAEIDAEAAEVLQFYLVGYACLRRFYLLRDEDAETNRASQRFRTGGLARMRMAAKALVAAVNSAADSIYGGLYDAERQSAIPVDGLLTLLGEATGLAAQGGKQRVFDAQQLYALLAAVEDLETVNSRVYDATDACLQAALRNYHGSTPPSPHAMLKKSFSSGTQSAFSFSLLGSEMLARSEEGADAKSIGSMVFVGGATRSAVERGWDWRAQFNDKGATGADVLRRLRLVIASELSVVELEEEIL